MNRSRVPRGARVALRVLHLLVLPWVFYLPLVGLLPGRESMDVPSLEEMETHLNLCAADRDTWDVYSDDPVLIRRLEKIAMPYKVAGRGKWFKLRADQVVLRTGKRVLSPAQQEASRKGLLAIAAARSGDGSST